MAIQLSEDVRNARLDAIQTVVGASPYLDFRTGAQPVDTVSADSGVEVEHMALPSSWLSTAASGAKTISGLWTGTADADGTVAHFRIKDNSDTSCKLQGSVTGTGGGGDMEVDNVAIVTGQTITVNTFTLTDGNV